MPGSWWVVGLVIILGMGAGCARFSSARREVEIEEVQFSFDKEAAAENIFNRYRISSGDVLEVMYHVSPGEGTRTFRLAVDNEIEVKFPEMPDLNETAIVRPDGNISLPYLGEVQVAGMTVEALTTDLKARYGKILRAPELFVAVPDFRHEIRQFREDFYTSGRGLSRLVTVRPDGYASFYRVGTMRVAGRTLADVQTVLNRRYADLLPGLSADLMLEEYGASRIFVLGQVDAPGAFEIDRPTSVIEALALAGSPLSSAKLGNVVVMRRRAGKMIGMKVDARSALHLRRNSVFFHLQPGDIVYVPQQTISKIADVADDVARILFFRGWGVSLEFDPFRSDLVPISSTVKTETRSDTDVDEDGNSTTRSTSTETRDTEYDYRRP